METVVTRNFALELGERKTSDTFPAVLSTEAPVERSSFEHGRFLEVLSHQPGAIDLGRAPLPLIVSHDSRALPLGVIENVRVENRKLKGDVRFSSSEAGKQLQADVDAGIVRSLSVAYRILEHQKTKAKETLTITATRWEPYEASAVSIPADRDAGFFRGIMEHEQITHIPDTTQTDQRTMQERERVSGIMLSCRTGKLSDEFATGLINSGKSLEAARADILQELFKRDAEAPGPRGMMISGATDFRDRGDQLAQDLVDRKIGFRGLAEMCLRASGQSVPNDPGQMFSLAMRSGSHSTSDYPIILGNAADKILRKMYAEAPSTLAWVERTQIRDFKPKDRIQVSEMPGLKHVVEGGEIEHGTFGESKETITLLTYARQWAITRQGMVNDDTHAFEQTMQAWGRQARRLEHELVYAKLAANPVMSDGVALFHATHGNLGTAGALNDALLAAGEVLMRSQTGLQGEALDLFPQALLVGPSNAHTARVLLAKSTRVVTSGTESDTQWASLDLIVENRLPANVAYMVAYPSQGATAMELGTLSGEPLPKMEHMTDWDTEAFKTKIRYDLGVAPIDYRAIVKLPIS